MLVTAICTACFSRAKINKKLWPPYFKIRPPYFEYSGAGTATKGPYGHLKSIATQIFMHLALCFYA